MNIIAERAPGKQAATSHARADLGRVLFKWTAPANGRTVPDVACELGITTSAAWVALGTYLATGRGQRAALAEQPASVTSCEVAS